MAMDAQYYAKDYGVELSEAIRRLTLQEPIGKLGATLESNEAGTLGGFWIQHEPEYRVVAAFTKDGEKTMAKYVQDGPLLDLIEVRTVDATLKELKRAQQEAGSIVSGLGFRAASGINVFENQLRSTCVIVHRSKRPCKRVGKRFQRTSTLLGSDFRNFWKVNRPYGRALRRCYERPHTISKRNRLWGGWCGRSRKSRASLPSNW